MKIAYNDEWDDEQWREENFSEEVIHSARYMGIPQPSADELIKAAKRFGTEGILESAVLLTQKQYRRVEKAVKEVSRGK